MALGDSYRDDLLTAIADRAATPAGPSVPKFSAWSAIPRGVGEAGAQVGATLSDVAASFRYMRDASPEQRKQIDRQGVPIEQFSSRMGDDLRDFGKTLRPDPLTASTAESVLYGFARGASKIVAGAVAGGVPGVLAAGIEEGITQSDELRRQGVDLKTRTDVGLVQGAGLALAALPAAGATLKSTAALYLAGGPGGFVAQQALTREILRNAGQDKLAEQFDPFDPVGLAVAALVPAPFAFYGLRASKRAAAAKAAEDFRAGALPSEPTAVAGAVREAYAPEVVDAAMVLHSQQARAAAQIHTFGDTRAADAHDAALTLAEGQMARGERVNVADLIEPPRVDLARTIEAEISALEAQRAELLPAAGALADRGEVAAMRRELALMEQNRPDSTDTAIKDLAKEIQVTQGVSYKTALSEARRQVSSAVAEFDAKTGRIEAAITRNAAAQRAIEQLAPIDRAIADATRRRDEAAPFSAFRTAIAEAARSAIDQPVRQTDATIANKAANPEAATPARGAGESPAAAADAGRSAADVQTARLTPGDKAEGAAVLGRLAEVQATHPDLQVMLDGMDRPMPLADFLAAVKAEADEMTADAPLMQVAAACALQFGV